LVMQRRVGCRGELVMQRRVGCIGELVAEESWLQRRVGHAEESCEPSLVPADLVLSTLLIDSFTGSIPRGIGLLSLTYLWSRLM
jgi:hypothetical protein